jgi:two-component system, NtrC family, sensor kinase
MQLRTKVTLIISAVILFSLGANYAIQHLLIAPSFRSLEESEALADWQRCRQAIDRELQTLDYLCFDWSAWDDTYTYIQDKNPDFFGACLENKDWYLDQEIHVLYFVRPDGTVHFSNIVQNDPANPVKLSLLPPDRLPLDHPLLQVQPDKESFVRGIFLTELGVTMFAARPLLTSENTGPAQGVVIFGRVLNDKAIARLADQTEVEFAAIDVRSTSLSAEQRDDIAAALVSDAPFETVHDDGLLTVTGLVRDAAGNPAMALQSRCDRAITAQGAKALNFATASIAVTCAITLGTLLIGLQFIMIKPIGELTAHARQVGETGQLSARLEPKGSDEFATLAKAFNRMLDQLAESRAQTVSLSRQAGKAEIAASVMHNIGNALTNVNVIAERTNASIDQSKVENVARVASLLDANRGDLPGLFGPNGKGAQLPDYLGQLATRLEEERGEMRHNLAGIVEGLRHVASIVSSHQRLAKAPDLKEQMRLVTAVDRSLALIHESLQRHNVALTTSIDDSLAIHCDPSRFSQVLVNLITNAKDAMKGRPEGTIHIRGALSPTGRAMLEVSDTGPGVDAENRTRLFTKGFTTKPSGHGIGLHYCWLAAREMGGSLEFVGNAEPHGAIFRFEIPVSHMSEAKAA